MENLPQTPIPPSSENLQIQDVRQTKIKYIYLATGILITLITVGYTIYSFVTTRDELISSLPIAEIQEEVPSIEDETSNLEEGYGISLEELPESDYTDNANDSENLKYKMNVLVLKYFPLTNDGENIDLEVTGDVGEPYMQIRQKTIDITRNLTIFIPKATTYLGYKDQNAENSLSYSIINTEEYETAVPMLSDSRKPDYNQILKDNDICNYVENKNVNEVWIWAYQGPTHPDSDYPYLNISESKMSGPFGDISNSYREDNMPRCSKTYVVLTFNYSRGTAEAIHSWSHQIEAEIDAVDTEFFREKWQGPVHPQAEGVNGICGSVHNPPNASEEYEYANSQPQMSDCLDWNPNSTGKLSAIDCTLWGCDDLSDTNNPQLNYIVWNWQNLPGQDNTKSYQGRKFRNFWDIHGDFDSVMAKERSLFE